MAISVKKMGWIPDLPDHRDHQFSAPLAMLKALPHKVDLRPKFKVHPYDQGRIGSCTANAIAGAIQFCRERANLKPDFTPSRLFIYYNERKAEHTIPLDHGAMIRTGIKSVNKVGTCSEHTWPYDDTPADPDTELFAPGSKATQAPSNAAYGEAEQNRVLSYSRVARSLVQMKSCLVAGFPFTVGFSVYDSMYDGQGHPKKVVPLPSGDDSLLGGHAVLAVGYDDESQQFTLRNSWGTHAQDHGYFYMPYAYLTDSDLADDFWTIRLVSSPSV
jgi:C1A family cysteine protease